MAPAAHCAMSGPTALTVRLPDLLDDAAECGPFPSSPRPQPSATRSNRRPPDWRRALSARRRRQSHPHARVPVGLAALIHGPSAAADGAHVEETTNGRPLRHTQRMNAGTASQSISARVRQRVAGDASARRPGNDDSPGGAARARVPGGTRDALRDAGDGVSVLLHHSRARRIAS